MTGEPPHHELPASQPAAEYSSRLTHLSGGAGPAPHATLRFVPQVRGHRVLLMSPIPLTLCAGCSLG